MLTQYLALFIKLMWLGPPNRIVVNLDSKAVDFDRPIIVDSDSNDLIKYIIYKIDLFSIKLI